MLSPRARTLRQETEAAASARWLLQPRLLGTGNFSKVFRAKDNVTGEIVAMKVVERSIRFEANAKARRGVESEVEILSSLKGLSHIVQLKDAFETPTRIYIAFELMEGGDLFERLVEKKVYPEDSARGVIWRILRALASLHARNIAHRDVKPENVLLVSAADDVDVRLADFGFAKRVEMDGRAALQTPCGSPGYVAPEIAEGTTYDKSVDIWSAGVMLYTLLCGYPPFYSESDAELLKVVSTGKFVFPAKQWRNVSREARELVRSLMRKTVAKRLTAEQALQHPWFAAPLPGAPPPAALKRSATPEDESTQSAAEAAPRAESVELKAVMQSVAEMQINDGPDVRPLSRQMFQAVDCKRDNPVLCAAADSSLLKRRAKRFAVPAPAPSTAPEPSASAPTLSVLAPAPVPAHAPPAILAPSPSKKEVAWEGFKEEGTSVNERAL